MNEQLPGRVLYSASLLDLRINDMAREISTQLRESNVDEIDLVTILEGGGPFSLDFKSAFLQYDDKRVLIRDQTMKLKSTIGTSSTGSVQILKDLDYPVEGRVVLVAEDIMDTGLTAEFIMRTMYDRGAIDVVFMAMVDKPRGRLPEYENVRPYMSGFVYMVKK